MVHRSYWNALVRAVKHLLDVLEPYTKEKGGLLKVDHVAYVEGRGNLLIEYDNVSVVAIMCCFTIVPFMCRNFNRPYVYCEYSKMPLD